MHLTQEAFRRLGLNQVWWLVSPQNPLKARTDMAKLSQRLAQATDLAARNHLRRVVVSDVEALLGEVRTALTLRLLKRRYPGAAFVWLMGADNLANLQRWWRWPEIFRTARVAVFDRSPYSYRALASPAAQRFSKHRRADRGLWNSRLPAWCYVAIRRHPASATALRAQTPRTKTRR